ncbi:MAG: hypothetical protein P8Y70_07375, partial [Candidatus Lokiarchaeota archaeon]
MAGKIDGCSCTGSDFGGHPANHFQPGQRDHEENEEIVARRSRHECHLADPCLGHQKGCTAVSGGFGQGASLPAKIDKTAPAGQDGKEQQR